MRNARKDAKPSRLNRRRRGGELYRARLYLGLAATVASSAAAPSASPRTARGDHALGVAKHSGRRDASVLALLGSPSSPVWWRGRDGAPFGGKRITGTYHLR